MPHVMPMCSITYGIFSFPQCSTECGSGSQQRAVVCLMKSDEGFNVMPPYECSSLDKPLNQQSCHLKPCGAMWYHTDWSAVSNCTSTCPHSQEKTHTHAFMWSCEIHSLESVIEERESVVCTVFSVPAVF